MQQPDAVDWNKHSLSLELAESLSNSTQDGYDEYDDSARIQAYISFQA